jgi:hypothetical protein
VKFVVLVEGDTEKQSIAGFLKRWLDPQLREPVGVKVALHQGHADLTKKIVRKAQMYLDGPDAADILGVVGLLDLYGPDFYPTHLTMATERRQWGQAHFEKLVARDRFRMCFAVHEFEAWLLSEPALFPAAVANAFPEKIAQPEAVNFNEPPAKLLDRLYREKLKKRYRKTTDGKLLINRLDPLLAAGKCPVLGSMLNEMLAMAKAAGL